MSEFKIGWNAKMDMLKFKNLGEEREKIIAEGSSKDLETIYKSNTIANLLHPKGIKVKVSKIVKETDNTKSFYLEPMSLNAMPPFMAGEYITVLVKIDNRIYKRPYSISSSPDNLSYYRITMKQEGVVSTYMLKEIAEGDILNILGPFGHFTYSKIRDQKDVLLIAGGSGITPFMSYLQSSYFLKNINSVTLLYGAKNEFELIFKKEIDAIASQNPKVKVAYILSEEKRSDYEYGFIDEEKLRRIGLENKSIFLSGPVPMYFYISETLKKLDIPNKYIRHEIFTETPENLENKQFTLTVKMLDKTITIPCQENETLITSMEKARAKTLVHCTVGTCGFCRSKLLSGEVKTDNSHIRMADKEENYIHPCVTYPLSDVVIEVPIK